MPSSMLRFHIGDNSLLISAYSPEVGEIKEEILATIAGNSMDIAFNAKYLLDALKAVDSENVLFILTGPVGPALLKIDGEMCIRDRPITFHI